MAKSSHAFMLGMGKNKNNRHISKIMLLIAVMGLTLVTEWRQPPIRTSSI